MHTLFGLGFWFDCITRFKLFFSLHSSRGMGLDDSELVDDSDGGGKASLVHCSICLEIVAENRDRSWAKLQCGHQFHLDCIGSAFNIKGAMQCPNCRKIEKGQWLYANGSRPFPEFSVDDLAHEEDLYDLGYSEMSFGVHWCPFSGLTRLPSSFEDAEFSTSGYHDILGQAILAEQASVSSTAHPCPYVAYFGPIHPSSSSIGGNAADNLNFGSNWNSGNGTSVAREVSAPSYGFPSMDLHYRHSSPFSSTSHIGNAEAQRPVRTGSDIPRSGSFLHPFVVGHSPGGRTGSSAASSMVPPPPYPGSNARARDRVQALQAYYQQQQPNSPPSMRAPVMSGNRRFGHRGLAPPTDQSGGFYFFPSGASTRNPENNASSRFQGWERESSAGQIERDSGRDSIRGWIPEASGPATTTGSRGTEPRERTGHEPFSYLFFW